MQVQPTGNCFTNSHKGHHKVRNVQFGTEMTVKIMHIYVENEAFTFYCIRQIWRRKDICKNAQKQTNKENSKFVTMYPCSSV